jgi:hypothetical protein
MTIEWSEVGQHDTLLIIYKGGLKDDLDENVVFGANVATFPKTVD